MHHWNQMDAGDSGSRGRVADRLPPHLDRNQAGQHVPQTNPLGPPRPGETVLVLGATEPEECIRAADNVGLEGRVIGIEADDERLALCRAQLAPLLQRAGYKNLTFRKARFDDLKLDRERVDAWLRDHPVQRDLDLLALEAVAEQFRVDTPVVADDTVDLVIARGALSRVMLAQARATFSEIFRVLHRGGRVLLSGVASDEEVPKRLYDHPALSSAGITGSVCEDQIVRALEDASFYGIHIIERRTAPRLVVEGIEFRDVVLMAYKGKEGPCWECNQAVVYRGPFKSVEDDDGHVLYRGVRIAVCEKTFRIFSQQPYRDHVELIQPAVPVSLEAAEPFPCSDDPIIREPKAQKVTVTPSSPVPAKALKAEGVSCAPGASCCR